MAEQDVLPLQEMPESQRGTSIARGKQYQATVSNAAGYLCNIRVDCEFDVPPKFVFDVFCHPDNAGAFRDIKRVGYRKVVEASPGFKRVEVEQCGELRVLWICRVFRTYLDVTEDAREPECLRTEFSLLRSDILSRFHGSWELRPVRDAASGAVTGCRAALTQDILPKGVPTFFAHLPVLGGLLRRVSLNTISRLMDDIVYIVKKYKAGGPDASVDSVLAAIAAERGHRTRHEENRSERLSDEESSSEAAGNGASSGGNGASQVASFAIDSFSDSEDGGEEEDRKSVV